MLSSTVPEAIAEPNGIVMSPFFFHGISHNKIGDTKEEHIEMSVV